MDDRRLVSWEEYSTLWELARISDPKHQHYLFHLLTTRVKCVIMSTDDVHRGGPHNG